MSSVGAFHWNVARMPGQGVRSTGGRHELQVKTEDSSMVGGGGVTEMSSSFSGARKSQETRQRHAYFISPNVRIRSGHHPDESS